MKKRGKTKKGISPVVSTILLIAIVLILAIIIFLWASSFIEEIGEKNIGGVTKTADKFCSEVNFRAFISDGEFYVKNEGNIPIYEVNVKRSSGGKSTVKNYTIDLDAGAISDPISPDDVGLTSPIGDDEVTITPVLMGKVGNTKKKYVCDRVNEPLEE